MELRIIRKKLSGLRTRLRSVLLAGGALRVVVTAGAVAAASFALDWLFHLPPAARVVLLLVGLAVLAHAAWRWLFRPAAANLDDEALALMVEERHPELDQELISALDFARRLESGDDGGESRELMRDVVTRTSERAAALRFEEVVRTETLTRPALAAAVVVVVAATVGALFPAETSLWFRRSVLLRDDAWPPRTRLEVRITNAGEFRQKIAADGVREIWAPEGSVLRVEVEAFGEIPDSVRLRRFALPRSENPSPINIDMPARPQSATFEYKFGRVASSFEFFVQGGDDLDETPTYRVHVRSAPRIDALLVDYDYPEHVNAAGMPDRTGAREYNVVGPRGTRVTMTFTVSAPLDRFDLVLDGDEDAAIALPPDPEAPFVHRHEMVLDRDHFYTWRLLGENGAPSRQAPDFNIVAQPDQPPQIVLAMPDTVSIDVSERALVPIEMRVSDDWGIEEIALRRDLDRDGAHDARIVLGPDDLLDPEGRRREIVAFLPVEVAALEVVTPEGRRAPRPGDTLFLRPEARDGRSTALEPEPNVTVYPSPIALNVREPAEIERELGRGQVRTKELVSRAYEAVTTRLEQLEGMLQAREGGGVDPAALHDLLAGHALVTSSLGEAARGYVRTFDGHLFNRTDASALTERLIADVVARHRASARPHHEHVRDALAANRRTIDDAEPMGKVARIADGLFVAAETDSPAVDAAVRAALDAGEGEDLYAALARVRDAEAALARRLDELLGRMRDWEDFQDVIQSLKDILDLQTGLLNRVKTLER